jgi:hypothetical protein
MNVLSESKDALMDRPEVLNLQPHLMRPASEVSLVCAALFLAGLPPWLPDATVTAECYRFGSVLDIFRPLGMPKEEAFVLFADIRYEFSFLPACTRIVDVFSGGGLLLLL